MGNKEYYLPKIYILADFRDSFCSLSQFKGIFIYYLVAPEALGTLVPKPGQDSRDFGKSEFSMKPLKQLSYANQFIYHLWNFLAPKWSGSCWMFLLKFGCANITSYLSFLSTVLSSQRPNKCTTPPWFLIISENNLHIYCTETVNDEIKFIILDQCWPYLEK